MKQATIDNGMKCPFEIAEIGKRIGIDEDESYMIAEILFKKQKVRYFGIGYTLIQLV